MKTGILAALAAAGLSLALATTAWAQSLPLPSGSYRSSCENARAMSVSNGGRLLTAQCRTSSGSTRNTSLRYETCRGDIANNNGALSCSRSGGGVGTPPPVVRPPTGSYQQSCRNVEVRGNTLYASCQTSRGDYRQTSINPSDCRGRDIANNDGRLTCATAGGGDRPPSGSYQQSCRDASMNGWTLSASCRDSRGAYQRSSLNTRDCGNRDIANDNGRLSCTSNGGGNRPPSGSYQSSCRDASMSGQVLSASCRDSRGAYQRSSLDTRNCGNRDIANVNGRLSCTGGGNGGGSGQIPRGSYQETCRNAYMTGFTLNAQCKLTFGSQTRNSSIDTRTCGNRDIANVNGVLTCGNAGGGSGGGSTGALTLYSQRDFGGRTAAINGAAAGLGQWSMADKAYSVRVRSGRWQLCTEPNFRGKCVNVDRDERDLSRLGLGGNVSSVRPR